MSVRPLSALLMLALAASSVRAQVDFPPLPETYDVEFRYRIRTDRDERIRQYRAMTAELTKLGFVPADKPDSDLEILDPAAEFKSGTIPAKNAKGLLDVAAIRTVVVRPAGTKLADPKKPVRVRIDIPANFKGREQRLLHEQTVAHLGLLEFAEAVGYWHNSFSIIRGTVPAGVLPKLNKDLRSLPGGWLFSANSPDALPEPFASTVPLRFIEVLPDFPAESPGFKPAPDSGKLTAELKAIVDDPMRADKPIAVEAVFEADLGTSTRDERFALRSLASGASVEGIVGRVATVRLPKASLVPRLAEYSEVRHVRLPRMASETAKASMDKADADAFLKESNLAELHKRGYRGAGVKIVVIASEFPDLAAQMGKGLPVRTQFFDLTGEVLPSLRPLPALPGRVGTGTAAALAAAAAAPDAAIVCVRIDPESFHQPFTVARAVTGELGFSDALVTRSEEMTVLADRLLGDRRVAVERYRRAIANLTDDPKAKKERDDSAAELKGVQKREADFRELSDRFAVLKGGLENLKGASVVINTLVWETGHPHDGLSAPSQYLDRKFATGTARSAIRASKLPPAPSWIQAGSISSGQIWAGAFLDRDENGVMEFTASTDALPKRWTTELNFLNYAATGGASVAVLPKDLKVRISVQWREPHSEVELLTVEPAFPLRLRLLRQVDPEAKAHATDDFAEVARSVGAPVRIASTITSGTYEASFDVSLPADGVYALRLEGGLAAQSPIKAVRQGIEIRPRVMVEILDTAQAAKGTVRFDTYAPAGGGVGIPGDAAAAVSIGQTGSATGSGPGIAIGGKPELRVNGAGQGLSGTAIGAGYAGGLAASVLPAGVRTGELIGAVGWKAGAPPVLPKAWIESLPLRTTPK